MASSTTIQLADKPATELITSWADAYNRGNTLLYFPREIRDEIYKLAITTDPKFALSTATNPEYDWDYATHSRPLVSQNFGVIRVPGICRTSEQMHHESMPIFIRHTKFSFKPVKRHYDWDLDEFLVQRVSSLLSKVFSGGTGFSHVRTLGLHSVVFHNGYFNDELEYKHGRKLASACMNLEKLVLGFKDFDLTDHPPIAYRASLYEPDPQDLYDLGINIDKIEDLVAASGLDWLLGFKKLKVFDFIVDWDSDFYSRKEMRGLVYDDLCVGDLAKWVENGYKEKGSDG